MCILLLKCFTVDLIEHQTILAFLDKMLRDAAEEPFDLEADAIIRAYFKRNPESAYRITIMAMQGQGSDQMQDNTSGRSKSASWRWPRLLFWGQD